MGIVCHAYMRIPNTQLIFTLLYLRIIQNLDYIQDAGFTASASLQLFQIPVKTQVVISLDQSCKSELRRSPDRIRRPIPWVLDC